MKRFSKFSSKQLVQNVGGAGECDHDVLSDGHDAQAGEQLRDGGQQDPHHQGRVQQGQGADEDLRGGR